MFVRSIDWERQAEVAERAFLANGRRRRRPLLGERGHSASAAAENQGVSQLCVGAPIRSLACTQLAKTRNRYADQVEDAKQKILDHQVGPHQHRHAVGLTMSAITATTAV